MSAQLALRYQGRRGSGRVAGIVHAASMAQARARVSSLGVSRARLRIAWGATVLAWLRPRPDPFDLETLYSFLARAFERGYARTAVLGDAAGIIHDPRLRVAVQLVAALVREGAPLARAMTCAGFPERDCRMAQAGEDAGNLVAAFEGLAREVRREAELRRSMRRLLLPPAILAASAWVLSWCAFVLLSPPLARVFADNGQVLALPGYARAYYAFVVAYNDHLAAASILHAAAGIGVLAFARSTAGRRLAAIALPPWARIQELSGMARSWGAFSAMLDGGMAPPSIARQLALLPGTAEAQGAFRRFEQHLRAGVSTERAVERAGFPRYVVSGIQAACGSGALARGAAELAERLSIQVSALTHRLQALVAALCALTGALVVLGFAAITVLPQLTALLGSF